MAAANNKHDLPDDIEALKQLILQDRARQQHNLTVLESKEKAIARKQRKIDRLEKSVGEHKQRTDRFREKLVRRESRIEVLEEYIARLKQRQFGSSSEKHTGQYQLFNEMELVAAEAVEPHDEPDLAELINPAAKKRKRTRTPALPAGLPEVVVKHELPEEQTLCTTCGETLQVIGVDTSRQLGVVPQQHFIIVHECSKYACQCGKTMKTATKPTQPIPGSVASAPLLAHIITSKLLDGLPLYRQEKMARREGIDLPRTRTARWSIQSATLCQPIVNLLQDQFFSYDIALSDATGIQVLKEPGRCPESNSHLWIRRGGPPDKPVILVDYNRSKSGEVVKGLLDGLPLNSYLVCDGASNFNAAVRERQLRPVFCNDHARRRFHDVLVSLQNTSRRLAEQSVAAKAIARYKALYRIERQIKDLDPLEKQRHRVAYAEPLWDEFIQWAKQTKAEGVSHEGTLDALNYLINHSTQLRRYCEDGRLPISNIQSEHVAKTIAVARKNFLCVSRRGTHQMPTQCRHLSRNPCCTSDEGRSLGKGLQGHFPNHRLLRHPNGYRGERVRKRQAFDLSGVAHGN